MKKSIQIIIITLVFVLAAFFVFNAGNNITGMPTIVKESVGQYPYVSLFALIITYILLMYLGFSIRTARGRLTHELKDELDEFKVSRHYGKKKGPLRDYVEHSLSQGKKESDIKDILSEQGWDEGLVDKMIEKYKRKK